MPDVNTESPQPSWKKIARARLPLLGHRNWIVVADAAYPEQSAAGIATILADAEQLDAVRMVLAELAAAPHVKPNIYLDRELGFVAEADAPGIDAYRLELDGLLRGYNVQRAPHEEIIARLDRAAQRFHVLIVKTGLTIPYTSVFFELDCAYWNAEAEARLRAAMNG